MKRKISLLKYSLIFAFILLPVFSAAAKDMGLILDQSGSYEKIADADELQYTGTLIPWFSTPLGSTADLYLSAGVSAQYEYEKWKIIPELLRTELSLRMGETGTIQIGRMNYADPLGFIAAGLFDGARYSMDFGGGSMLGIGVWYTGFLYKKKAHITMTADDLAIYDSELDYGNFYDTYFAPRRLVAAVDWEHPCLAELIRLRLALIGQFDFSGNDELYHSQYLIAKAAIPVQQFVFELGASAELAEAADEYLVSFAGELGISWALPTPIQDRLMLLGRFSGGTINDTIAAFVPINTESQGYVLRAKLSGLSMLRLEYTARLHQTFSIDLSSSYFILSDKGTYQGLGSAGYDGYFLGNEFYGLAIWSPVSDLQIRAGGGAFLSSMGNAVKNGDVRWRVDLNVVLALF